MPRILWSRQTRNLLTRGWTFNWTMPLTSRLVGSMRLWFSGVFRLWRMYLFLWPQCEGGMGINQRKPGKWAHSSAPTMAEDGRCLYCLCDVSESVQRPWIRWYSRCSAERPVLTEAIQQLNDGRTMSVESLQEVRSQLKVSGDLLARSVKVPPKI